MLEHHGMSTLSLSNNFISQSSVCGVCVLKREHHCMFAGYCVGHFNHRFFVLFLAWLWLGVLYCTYLNSLYVWTGEIYHFVNIWFTFHRRVRECVPVRHVQVCLPPSHPHVWNGLVLDSGDEKYPLLMFFNWNNQVAIFFWSVHVAALLLTTVLLVYHVRLIQTGATTFEANRKINSYNLGWRQNWREVLGERWYLALVNPFVKSKLPHNGVIWDTQNTWRLEAPKNRWD